MARFVDGKFLAKGGFGKVYRYFDTEEERWVAIKYLQKIDEEARRRFSHEIRLLQRHRGHPNIAFFVGHGESPRRGPYLIVRYYPRGSLRQWVEVDAGWKRVAFAVMDAAAGLAEVHSRGGFHRDVKPDNLLLSWSARKDREVVRLSDFGLAREPLTEDPCITRSARGTRVYMAPEVLIGEPFRPSADVYSLGVTAGELLSGERRPRALDRVPIPTTLRDVVTDMRNFDRRERPHAIEVARELNWLLTASEADRRLKVVVRRSA